jgi:AcrR family transcriptional regulator
MDMQDRRVKRTQKALVRAMISLTLEKGYESITIRDISERAEIGYATFFRHYHDKEALLKDVLEVVLAEMKALLQESINATNYATTGTLIFSYVQEHSEVVNVFLSSRGSSSLVQGVIKAGAQNILNQNKALTDSQVPPEIAAYSLVSSTISLIQWWLENQMPYSPERMGIIYQELIASPVHTSAFHPH